jgi:hypothetical protein
MIKKVGMMLMGFLMFTRGSGQEVGPAILNSGGGSSELSTTFHIDWSIGESTVIETLIGRWPYGVNLENLTWNITSGILQPKDKKSKLMSALNVHWTEEEVRCYPVPATTTLILDFLVEINGRLRMQILNQYGRAVITKIVQVSGQIVYTFDITTLLPGTYFLSTELLSAEGRLLKSGIFRIIKL